MISHCWRRNTVTSLHWLHVFYKMYTNIIHTLIQQRQKFSNSSKLFEKINQNRFLTNATDNLQQTNSNQTSQFHR